MKLRYALLVPVALLISAGLASASAVTPNNDPNFGIKDPVSCTGACIDVTSSVFSFTVPSNGTGQVEFVNGSGQTFASLTLDLFADPGTLLSDVTCSIGAFFQFCNVTQLASTQGGNTEFQFQLFGTSLSNNQTCANDGDNDDDDQCGGIGNGQFFFLDFTSPTGNGPGWIGSQSVTATANAAPEPGTLVLIATGLMPLWSLRRRLIS